MLDQKGCQFAPRVLAVRTRQTIKVTNSDPVTHNVHPVAKNNREWNQSQAPGDPPIERRFGYPEVLIRVKCNVHNWMRSWIAVMDHPYYAITKPDGSSKSRTSPRAITRSKPGRKRSARRNRKSTWTEQARQHSHSTSRRSKPTNEDSKLYPGACCGSDPLHRLRQPCPENGSSCGVGPGDSASTASSSPTRTPVT